ncbi:hypothetical protein [Streptomyces sp. NPDC060194]|uniref:hypothetical protein n=1 Tax=Streptomyces sp. NPDC060194 TaxID=3347069 RepID=UPI00365BD13D
MSAARRSSALRRGHVCGALLLGLLAGCAPAPPEPPSRVALTFPVDLSDPAALTRTADDLFVGRVTARRGQSDRGIGIESQYDVRVEHTLKGSLTGVIVVNQQGGLDADGRAVDLPEGDELLHVGERYRFATRYSTRWGFHTVIPVHGDIRL